MSNYNVNSIKTMEFGEAANKRIGMYLSADGHEAVFLGLREIISNSVDEYLQGYGKEIIVNIDTKKQVFSVKDFGRGIPCGTRPDGTNSLVAALTLPHTGGKLDNEVYNSAIGLNGIGASVVSHTAEWLIAVVHRDGKRYTVRFEHTDKGAKQVGEIEELKENEPSGTFIEYKPFAATYNDATLDLKMVRDYLDELQYLTPGLKITVTVDGTTTTYFSANGLSDALDPTIRFHKNPLVAKGEVDNVKIEFALQWAKSGSLKYYANSLYMKDGGAFTTGLKTSLTKAFNSVAEKEFKGDLIRKYLTGYISIKVKTPQFSNQAKTSLANPEARTAVAKFTTDTIKAFFAKYPNDLAAIVKVIEVEQKAEDAANRAREAAEKIKSGGKSINALKDLPSKLADCSGIVGCELYLCEGDSAAGGAKQARDPRTQAIMPLRGKILNTCTKDIADMLKNKEIRDITTALGTGIGEKFNIRNLRYDKIIIESDADEDGRHISLLICTLFLYHFPEIVKAGKLYRAVSPFYSVTSRGGKKTYFYSTEELNEYRKSHKVDHVTRYKGLGELRSDELWDTTMNPETRRLLPLTVDDLKSTIELFDTLMGRDAKLRREFITENAEEENYEEEEI